MFVLTVEAIYENGILRLNEPLPLKEHERVRVTILPVCAEESDNWVERTKGMLKWKGDPETLERLVMDPELQSWES